MLLDDVGETGLMIGCRFTHFASNDINANKLKKRG
jgi:hypothetical protein